MDEQLTTETPSDGTPAARKGWSTRRKVITTVALGLVAIIVAAVGVFAFRLQSSTSQIEAVEEAFPDESLRPEPFEGEGNAPLNYLLLGTDTREEGASLLDDIGSRSDTILVVHIPADRESVQVMSIMRDSYVDIPGYGQAKVNSALAYGGVPLLVQVVEGLIGQRIDDVAIIDFAGFEGLTTALGGVTVQNETAFTTRGGDYTFAQGEVTLSGEQALAYVRERYAFSDGDYQRVRNQQAFMRALLDRMLQPSVIGNPITLTNSIDAIAPYVATTDGLTNSVILGLAADFAGSGRPTVNTFTLPTNGTGMVGSESVVFVDYEELALVQAAFQQESMNDFVPPAER